MATGKRWRKAFASNIDNYFFCSPRFIQHRLQKGGKGKIITFTMDGALSQNTNQGA